MNIRNNSQPKNKVTNRKSERNGKADSIINIEK